MYFLNFVLAAAARPGDMYASEAGRVWLNALGDSLLVLAYFGVPCVLLSSFLKRNQATQKQIQALLGAAVVACLTVNVVEVRALWRIELWGPAVVKGVTTLVTLGAALQLARLMRAVLELPSVEQWAEKNSILEREVQERRALELQLRLSEAKYRETAALVDLTHDAMIVRDMKREIIFWNRAAEALYGWKREEALGHVKFDLLQTVFPKPVQEIDAEILSTGHWEGELTHRRKDGSRVVVASRWALSSKDGAPKSILESNRDISQRKNEEGKFRSFLEAAPDAVVIADEGGRIVLVNSQTEAMFGYPRAEILGQKVEMLLPHSQRKRHLEHRAEYHAHPKVRAMGADLELYGVRKDGAEFPVEISLSPLLTDEGVLVSASVRDISQRRNEGRKFRSFLEAAPDAVVIANQQGQIVLVNSQTEAMFGYPRAEILGQKVEMLLPHSLHGRHLEHRAAYHAHPKVRSMGAGLELYGVRKDGREFPVEISLSPLQTDEGMLVSTSVRDITDRKHAEEALQEKDEKLRLLVRGVHDYAIFMLDPNGLITTWNEGAERITGYEQGEILGCHISKFYTPPDLAWDKAATELGVATSTGRFEEEGWRVRKDGSLYFANIVITPLRDKAERLRGFGKVIRDISVKKLTDEELARQRNELAQKNAQLQLANKEMESFSYSVSHDLRSPLRTIDGFSHALLDDCGAQLSEEGKGHLKRIRTATQRMGQLIDDLLSLSQLSCAPMHEMEVDLSAMVNNIATELQRGHPERHVELRVAEGVKAAADPGLLRIALENLMGNAWKFTSRRAEAHIEFGVEQQDGCPAFFLRDDGAGFDPAYAGRLFGAFQRLHSAIEFEGTGVGLATVQRIIHRHGGRIWAESHPGEGATFHFTLRQAVYGEESLEFQNNAVGGR